MKQLTVLATIMNIAKVTHFVNKQLEALRCPPKTIVQIDIAVDELLSNIAKYAYHPEDGPATVTVDVDEKTMSVEISFIDHGRPFDPRTTKDPDTSLSAEERRIGGLGLFIVKKTMDDVHYEFRDGKNILTIRKGWKKGN